MSGRRPPLTLQPAVLRWARNRAGLDHATLARKVGVKEDRVAGWERSGQISFRQAEKLADATYTPFGCLFLPEPVEDRLPIADFRTVGDRPPGRPSPNLLDTVHAMQRRQDWMRDDLIAHGIEPPGFVGAFAGGAPAKRMAAAARAALDLAPGWAAERRSWEEALRFLQQRMEHAGILLVVNGVVGNDTSRRLDPDEFRGFALVDEYAPLIFVNNADFKAAQMFTLAHELAHLLIGKEGVFNSDFLQPTGRCKEISCNAVAAEFLVPEAELRARWAPVQADPDRWRALARRFRVSEIVAARRALDLGLVSQSEFRDFYRLSLGRNRNRRGKSGGDFWRTQNLRIGRRFGAAVVRAVLEDRLLYRDAYSLTDLRGETFVELVSRWENADALPRVA